MPAEEGGRGDEERRPSSAGEQPGQGRQHHAVFLTGFGPVHLAAQHRDLMAENQQFDVLRATITGQLCQHLQDLAEQKVHQRSAHVLDRRCYRIERLAQTRT